jgi:hypothetical protein
MKPNRAATTDPGDRWQTMITDALFMEWLEKYLPDWRSEYSGNILAMYDAFCAGRNT